MNQPLLSIRGLKTHFFGDEGITRAVDGVSLDVLPGQAVGIVGESGCGKSVMARSILRIVEKPGRIVEGEILLRKPAQGPRLNGAAKLSGAATLETAEAAGLGAGQAGPTGSGGVATAAAAAAMDAAAQAGEEQIDLTQLPEDSPVMRSIRGGDISLVFQEPMTSFSPVHTIGNQLIEAVRLHKRLSADDAAERAIELLQMVDLPRPEDILSSYAWQLSGGLRQRAMIAMALAGEPRLLIADEPTTALDVTTQAQILDLLRNLKRDTGMALMLITHDLAVVAGMADYVVVMYLGEVVEKGPVEDIFAAPQHPYTQALLRSIPSITAQARTRLRTIAGSVPHPFNRPSGCPFHPRCVLAIDGKCEHEHPPLRVLGGGREASCHLIDGQPASVKERAFLKLLAHEEEEMQATEPPPPGETMLEVRNLRKSFQVRASGLAKTGARMRAVDDVNFELRAGETLALVGESGSGKTTVSRCILRALQPDSGEMVFRTDAGDQLDLARLKKKQVRRIRSQMQMIFQDPYSSLNPRMTVLDIIAEPLLANGVDSRQQRVARVRELLELVGLPQQYMRRYPHAFSGGQRQRIGIARALAMNPRLVVADEPVSALDVSVQAQILNLLLELQEQLGLTYLFVSHDLSIVKHVSDRIAVMYAGNLVELGQRDEIMHEPKHPYTSTLLAAVPKPDPTAKKVFVPPLRGRRPNLIAPQVGCYFESRCAHAVEMCRTTVPAWREISSGRWARCHRAEELTLPGFDAALPAGALQGEARSDL